MPDFYYTHHLEIMYNGLRSFKHDYINILLSMSGYIANNDIGKLKQFFETKIFPTKALIDQGDYKLNQLSNETSRNIHKIILHAKDRQIEYPGTIKELTGALGADFVRCHRSFLVNKKNIKEIDAKNQPV